MYYDQFKLPYLLQYLRNMLMYLFMSELLSLFIIQYVTYKLYVTIYPSLK